MAEADAQEVAPEHDGEQLQCAVPEHLNRLPREVADSLSLEVFKNCPDLMLCSVL